MKNKIFITVAMLFFVTIIFNISVVSAVGTVSQAWKKDINGEMSLLFRVITGPHKDTVKEYVKNTNGDLVEGGIWHCIYNGEEYTSRWVYNQSSEYPDIYKFRTQGYAFHTERLGKYTTTGDKFGYNEAGNSLGYGIDTVTSAYRDSKVVLTTLDENKKYDEVVFHEIFTVNGNEFPISFGTLVGLSNLSFNKQMIYRYAIITINGSNIIIDDVKIDNNDVSEIIKKAKVLEKTDSCYVSNILYSETKYPNADYYEVAKTSKSFFQQYEKGETGWWSSNTRGYNTNNKAMSSVINLYDNNIEFPALTKRTVLVRHINVGNTTQISTSVVDKGERIKSTNLTLSAYNPAKTVNGVNTYAGYQEYYEEALDIEQGFTKSALANTSTYKCLGYNVGIANNQSGAIANVNNKINAGEYTKGTTVDVPSKTQESDNDYIVIDFYYTEYEKDVYVNHIYVDKDGFVRELDKQTIVPNETAIINGSSVNRKNQELYISEVYSKKLGYNVEARKADSLKENELVEYRGYEVFKTKTDISSLIGTQRLNLNDSTTANLTSDNIQVNFYYYYDNRVVESEPTKTVEGNVFVISEESEDLVGNCVDNENQVITTSIPSGTTAKVGIKGIPRYMVGAITTEYLSPALDENEKTIDVTLNFSFGDETKTVKYSGLKYIVGYYKVTDMAVYELKQTTVYDANHGHDGTSGDSMFDWEKGQKEFTPNNMGLSVVLKGINNKTIANNDINNINNYVAISITDKHGNTSTPGTSTSTLTREYLSTDELNKVDANGDKAIGASDKTFADMKLREYDDALKKAQENEANKLEEYNNIKEYQKGLEDILDAATTELDRLFEIYEDKSEKKSQKLISKTNIENELDSLKKSLEEKEKELEELQSTESTKLNEKTAAYAMLTEVETEAQRLNTIYTDSIVLRNQLEANANCSDELDDEVYIYVEIYKEQIEAAERCKLAKEEYLNNIENKVVENAKQAYENYVNTTLKNAQTEASNAATAYTTSVTDRTNKEGEISTLRSEISKTEVTVTTVSSDYHSFVNDEFIPAKNAYESYRDNEYKTAKDNYDNYVEADHLGKAKSAYEAAQSETTAAQAAYDRYYAYREYLYDKYDEYKALYDEFKSITGTNLEIAKTLGLKINIKVQNMIVRVNNTSLANAISSNTATHTSDLATYMTNKQVPQVKTEIPTISRDVYSTIGSTELEESDYTNSNKIDSSVLNGVRWLAGKAEYEAQVVIGSKKAKDIVDTVYYSDQSNIDSTVVFKLANTKLTRTYKVDTTTEDVNDKYKNVKPINIYTPISVSAKLESNTNQIVDQTKGTEFNGSMIQINTQFKIDFGNESDEDVEETYPNIKNTKRFSAGYYIKFEFDVHKVAINGKPYKSGNRIPAGEWIGIIKNNKNGDAYITAQAYGNVEDDKMDIISEDNSKYIVRAVAYNVTDLMLNRSTRYSAIEDMAKVGTDMNSVIDNICDTTSYFAETEYPVAIINRAYDFRVTDVKDLNWKQVFRNTTKHTGILYYAGTRKWDSKSEKSNNLISRTSSEIGRNPLRTLPIGPYKSTDITYVKAPKLGYRFSFDLKVTGAYYNSKGEARTDKKVAIETKFYYVSKDGKTYYSEYDGTDEGIYLFYKNSAGKYVRIDDNGGGYNLTFTPNDGYRYIEDRAKETLSTKNISLGNLRNLTLTYQMATVTNNSSSITYYGDYKLPNSTIAVLVNSDGTYDINNPLKDGYIGVVFEIVAYSGSVKSGEITQDVLLSYSKNTKENTYNTSQWDYEGFLGYTKEGQQVKDGTLSIKLEKGIWNIDDKLYNDIKGSVILYDLDERAATDYE